MTTLTINFSEMLVSLCRCSQLRRGEGKTDHNLKELLSYLSFVNHLPLLLIGDINRH